MTEYTELKRQLLVEWRYLLLDRIELEKIVEKFEKEIEMIQVLFALLKDCSPDKRKLYDSLCIFNTAQMKKFLREYTNEIGKYGQDVEILKTLVKMKILLKKEVF